MADIVAEIGSLDPADLQHLLGAIRFALKKTLQNTDDMLPAEVLEYDPDAHSVKVRPLIKLVATNGELRSREAIAKVPVWAPGANNLAVYIPVRPGSTGWIKAADRDMALFLKGLSEAPPASERMHNFSSSVFLPDAIRGFDVEGENADSIVIQTLDGSVSLAVGASQVRVKAPLVKIIGDVSVEGAISATGNISSDADVSAGTVTLKTLRVTSVTPGGGTSGVPVQ